MPRTARSNRNKSPYEAVKYSSIRSASPKRKTLQSPNRMYSPGAEISPRPIIKSINSRNIKLTKNSQQHNAYGTELECKNDQIEEELHQLGNLEYCGRMFASDDVTVEYSFEDDENVTFNADQKIGQPKPGSLIYKDGKLLYDPISSGSGGTLIDKKSGLPLISLRSLVNILRRHEGQNQLETIQAESQNAVNLNVQNRSVQTFRNEEEQLRNVPRDAIKVRNANDVFGFTQSPASNYTEANSIDPNFISGDYLLQSIEMQSSSNNANRSNSDAQYGSKNRQNNDSTSNDDFSTSDTQVAAKPIRCQTRIIRPKVTLEHQKLANCNTSAVVKPPISSNLNRQSLIQQKVHQAEMHVPTGNTLITDCSFAFDLVESRQDDQLDLPEGEMCELNAKHWWLNRRNTDQLGFADEGQGEKRKDLESSISIIGDNLLCFPT